MKTLSIIVTTLNANHVIKQFLESVQKQNSSEYKLVIVDAGSTDGTIQTIESFDLPLILKVKEKVSIYGGINEAIAICGTDYYVVCGSDDVFVPGAIKEIVNDINNNIEYDLLLYSVMKGEKIVKSYQPTFFRNLWGWQSIISSHSVGTVIKTKLHFELGFYDLRIPVLSDGEFLSKITAKSNSKIKVSSFIIGKFGLEGLSNKNYFNNIFSTFLIQLKFHSFFPQLIILMFRLVKYRKLKFINR
jgi:glycosyltransferase involved in cell wall biosynthesis